MPEDTEVVRGYLDAAGRGDFEAAMTSYAPDVVLVVPESVLSARAGTFAGREAVAERRGGPRCSS